MSGSSPDKLLGSWPSENPIPTVWRKFQRWLTQSEHDAGFAGLCIPGLFGLRKWTGLRIDLKGSGDRGSKDAVHCRAARWVRGNLRVQGLDRVS